MSFAVLFGVYQLRDLRRQRASASLERMFEEWRSKIPSHMRIEASMPVELGAPADRAAGLARYVWDVSRDEECPEWKELRETLATAREVVHSLNDVGVFVERGVVEDRDFFSHFHVRVIELAYRLEPYALLVSCLRGTRWGFRIRRLRLAAERYHRLSKIHAHLSITVGDHVLVPGRSRRRRTRLSGCRLRGNFIPSKFATANDEDALMSQVLKMLAVSEERGLDLTVLREVMRV